MSIAFQTEPRCVAVEERLVATVLSYPEVFPYLADFLAAEDFSEPLFGRIFEAITATYERGERWTVLTILPKFRGDPAFLELGKPSAYFARLAAIAGAPSSVVDYARVVLLFAYLRDILAVASDLEGRARRLKLEPRFDHIIEALDGLSNYVDFTRHGGENTAPTLPPTRTGAAPIGELLLAARSVAR
jgi:replicative DNA helicase